MSEESRGDFQKSRHRGGTLIPCTPDSTSPRDHTHNRPEKNVIIWKWEEQPGSIVNVLYLRQPKSIKTKTNPRPRPRLHISNKNKVTSICSRIRVCLEIKQQHLLSARYHFIIIHYRWDALPSIVIHFKKQNEKTDNTMLYKTETYKKYRMNSNSRILFHYYPSLECWLEWFWSKIPSLWNKMLAVALFDGPTSLIFDHN